MIEGNDTFLIIQRNSLIMLSPQLGPFRKLILGARGIHFPLQAQDFSP